MAARDKPILVLGATGRQGGAVTRHLRAQGWPVRALVRDPGQPAAQQLPCQGVELVQGDLNQPASLRAAMAGVSGVFSIQSFRESGAAGEERQGKAVADAAHVARVAHLVYSSVGGADRANGVPHFESKWHIEEHIRALGLPATILRPTCFMEEFRTWVASQAEGTLRLSLALKPETGLQMIAVDDIGAFAALAFEARAGFLGQAIELAGDELKPAQIRATFERVLDRPMHFEEVPVEELRRSDPEMGSMFAWFNQVGFRADIPALRRMYLPLQPLEAWIKQAYATPLPA